MSWFLILFMVGGAVLWKGFTLVVFPEIIRRWFTHDPRQAIEAATATAGPDLTPFLGREGITLTDLRPCGKARLGDDRHDVSSAAGFIPRGTAVRVTTIRNGGLVVEPLTPPGP